MNSKSCSLSSIYFKHHCLHIQIGIHSRLSNRVKHPELLFVERYTTKKISHSLSIPTSHNNELEAVLTETDLQKLLAGGKDWDVFMTHEADSSVESIRLSSHVLDLERVFLLKDGKMLAPFTTNNGNLSFKSQEPRLMGKAEQLNLIGNEIIEITGSVFHPLWSTQPEDMEGSLIFSATDGGHAFKLPLVIGQGVYTASVPISSLLIADEETVFNAKIEITYTEDGVRATVDTPPLKLNSQRFTKKTIIQKVNGEKKRISIYRTKKAKLLSIRISTYDFNNEISVHMKESLISIKRHSSVRKLFIKAFKWIGMFPANRKTIVFESFLGKQFSDNPRAIYEYLIDLGYPYKMYWSVDKKYLHNFQDRNLICIRRFSFKWLMILPRARFWVTNSRMPVWLPKPKHTIYLQTWHGTPLKRLAADMEEVYMPGTTAESYKRNFIKEAKNWDLLVSPNAYSTEIFRRAFHFDKEVLETGYPRNDFLLNHKHDETIEKLKKEYGFPLDKKVVLYAPTWRDNQFVGKGKYSFDIQLDLDLMKQELGEDYVVIFRLHYLVAENLDVKPYEGFAYDFSNHEDIRELYLMADLLITDYSSVFFDYANLERPMIFYVYDIEEYRDSLRGFYFDFEKEAPGPLVKSTEEVIETVRKMEADGFKVSPGFVEFHEKFCYLENGDSTRNVVENVFKTKKKNQLI